MTGEGGVDVVISAEPIEAIDSSRVSAECRGTELNKAVQVLESQSTCILSRRSGISVGIVVGWEKYWRGSHVLCRCDNLATVEIIQSCYSRDDNLMHLLCCSAFSLWKQPLHTAASPRTAK